MQMAMAYGALANGGILMEPQLIRELRDEQGRTIERYEPKPVRRVIGEDVARDLNLTLVEAVEAGTGTRARLASFAVAGKSGTSRAYGAAGYDMGAYYASFVGFFPAEDPQLVVFVKLDRPQGAYYGGATAAPVTRATMEAILAARKSPLDREALASIAQAQRAILNGNVGTDAVSGLPVTRVSSAPPAMAMPFLGPDAVEVAEASTGIEIPVGMVLVPDVRGFSPRTAARRLHRLGLEVVWESAGSVTGTVPAAGTVIALGEAVRLLPRVAPWVSPDEASDD